MSVWDDKQRVQLLKDWWAEGLSAGTIASRLGCALSRNAVISKVRRLGLPYRAKTTLRHKRSTKSLSPRRDSTVWPGIDVKTGADQHQLDAARIRALAEFNAAMTAKEEAIAPGERVTILTRDAKGQLVANDRLTSRCCRWPIGDPGHADFHFCGQWNVMRPDGSLASYCEAHLKRAHVPTPSLPQLPRPEVRAPGWFGSHSPSVLEADAQIGDILGPTPSDPSRVRGATTTH